MTSEKFAQIQQQKGLSDKKMAKFLGLKSRVTVYRYRTGKLEIPEFIEVILTLTGDLS